MAEFKIDGRMKVKTLKENFFNEFGGILRVYNGRSEADGDALLSAIRSNDAAKGGELKCRASRTVGKFEQEMWDVFGIKVQVATKDDWVLVLDGITLSKIKDIPKNATRKDMEKFLSYKREENTIESENEEVAAQAEDSDNSDIYADIVEEMEGGELIYLSFRHSDDEDICLYLANTPSDFFNGDLDPQDYKECDSIDLNPDRESCFYLDARTGQMIAVANGKIVGARDKEGNIIIHGKSYGDEFEAREYFGM